MYKALPTDAKQQKWWQEKLPPLVTEERHFKVTEAAVTYAGVAQDHQREHCVPDKSAVFGFFLSSL